MVSFIGAWDVFASQAPGMFPFFLFFDYTNVYLQINRLCIWSPTTTTIAPNCDNNNNEGQGLR
jgi:hypothetical protein